MTYEQITLFTLIGLVLLGLLWGKWRYDLVAFAALMIGVALGAVPYEQAFAGFGHEATIIVALVLIISAGLMRSGAVDLITRLVIDKSRSLGRHIAIFGTIAAGLSAFMNNVAALALLMPVDVQAAKGAGRSAARSLMPLSFATILGGMITLIGTPPNIIIASYRGEALGRSFGMFDFAPVGLACAAAGLLFIVFVGWRLIPTHKNNENPVEALLNEADYIAELVISKGADMIGKKVSELDDVMDEHNCSVIGLVRKSTRFPGRARRIVMAAGDILVVQGSVEAIEALTGAIGVKLQGKSGEEAGLTADMVLSEVVVTRDSGLIGRSANDIQMLRVSGVSLIGISRQGRTIKERLRRTNILPGDILLLLGTEDEVAELSQRMGCLPLANRQQSVTQHEKAFTAMGLFAIAIALSAAGILHLPIALGMVAVGFVLRGILPMREIYTSIEWPVIVLLGAMIPLGTALESSGGTAIIADGLAMVTNGMPGFVAIAVILIVTMTLSDVLNNTATAVIAAPIAIDLSKTLGVSADPFLMAVAVGASCAFLTPIGHKNNMLILGPGGYRFGDYWRMGLPLEAIIVAVAVPMIMLVWPF